VLFASQSLYARLLNPSSKQRQGREGLPGGSAHAPRLAGARPGCVSLENVETALHGIDAFNRRDLDAFFEHATCDYEWLPAMRAVEGHIVRGRAGIEAFLR
jgi:hypothetical protein